MSETTITNFAINGNYIIKSDTFHEGDIAIYNQKGVYWFAEDNITASSTTNKFFNIRSEEAGDGKQLVFSSDSAESYINFTTPVKFSGDVSFNNNLLSNILDSKVDITDYNNAISGLEKTIKDIIDNPSQKIIQANEQSLLVHDKIFDFGIISNGLHIPNFAKIPNGRSATCELWFNYYGGEIDWSNFNDTGIIWVDEYNYLQPNFIVDNFYSVVLRKVSGKKVYANIAYTFPG